MKVNRIGRREWRIYERVFARAPRVVSLKMRLYQVLPFLWCVVATQLAGKTLSSISRCVLIGSKSGN
jgi:hypothetical protein